MSLLRLLPPINNVVLGIIIGIAITFSFETRKVAIYELNRMLRIANFFRRWQFFFLFLCFFFRCWSELRNFIRKYRNAFTKNGCFFFDCGIGLIGIITWNWYVRYAVLKPNHTTIIKRHASFGFPSFSFPFSNHSERHVNCMWIDKTYPWQLEETITRSISRDPNEIYERETLFLLLLHHHHHRFTLISSMRTRARKTVSIKRIIAFVKGKYFCIDNNEQQWRE